jgi:hypothetical protein
VASSAEGLASAAQQELPSFGSSGGKRFLPVMSGNKDAHARFVKIGVKDCGGINCKIRGVIVRRGQNMSIQSPDVSVTRCVEDALSKVRNQSKGETDLANLFKRLQVLTTSSLFRSKSPGFSHKLTEQIVEQVVRCQYSRDVF